MPSKTSVALIIIGVITGILSIVALQKYSTTKSFDNWKKVRGVIMTSRYRTVHGNRWAVSSSSAYTVSSVRYEAFISYQYRYMGTDYSSTDYSDIKTSYKYKYFAKSLIDSYKEGSTVDVFVNPDNPTQAYLYFSSSSLWTQMWVLATVSVILIAGGIWQK